MSTSVPTLEKSYASATASGSAPWNPIIAALKCDACSDPG